MKTVNLVYALIQHGEKILLGVANTAEGAVELVRRSGYGYQMSESELKSLAILQYTVNRDVNFKIEMWQVHN
jgi:hypothetical protein